MLRNESFIDDWCNSVEDQPFKELVGMAQKRNWTVALRERWVFPRFQ